MIRSLAEPAFREGVERIPYRDDAGMSTMAVLWPLLMAAILLGLLWFGLKHAQKRGWLARWGVKLQQSTTSSLIEVVDRRAISPKTTVHVVKIEGDRYLLVESSVSVQLSKSEQLP